MPPIFVFYFLKLKIMETVKLYISISVPVLITLDSWDFCPFINWDCRNKLVFRTRKVLAGAIALFGCGLVVLFFRGLNRV